MNNHDANAKTSAIEAALNAPHSWRDLQSRNRPEIGANCLCVAETIEAHNAGKIFAVKLFSRNWNMYLSAIYFHAKKSLAANGEG